MAKRNTYHQSDNLFKRKMPKMPDGYYSGDRPNPNIRAFVKEHLKKDPYDQEKDDYDVSAFDKPIETTKATPIYNMHAYWSKKPHDAIRQHILHYTQPGDLVLDPFCGSGGTAVVALMAGRNVIAIDLSPAATFIASNYVRPVRLELLESTADYLISAFEQSEVYQHYITRCHKTEEPAIILRTIYSSRYRCERCLGIFALIDCPKRMIPAKSKSGEKSTTVCPGCLERGILEELSARSDYVERIPVATEYITKDGSKVHRRYNDSNRKAQEYFERYDLALILRAEKTRITNWYPQRYMMDVETDKEVPWGLLWRPYHRGIRKVEHFFTRRNLHAISTLFAYISDLVSSIEIQQVLRFAVTGILPGLSLLNRYRPEVSFPLNYSANTLYVPPVCTEENPLPHLRNKLRRIAAGYGDILSSKSYGRAYISTQDACNLSNIPDSSVDYIFTDPPYGYRIQYGELNFLWESWLNASGEWREKEIIINESDERDLGMEHWTRSFRKAMSECFRVLKPGRWLSLCFHDSSTDVWQAVQDSMAEVGFIPDHLGKVVAIETDYQTHKQIVAKQIAKRDLVIGFRKLRSGEILAGIELTDNITLNEKVIRIIRNFLEASPGAEKDRIYDVVISRMVQKGEMQSHDFDSLLNQVGEKVLERHENGIRERWFLKESEFNIRDESESKKEDASASNIGSFIEATLRENPELAGMHYSDIFEYYVQNISDKPRRPMSEWIVDYLYKTEEGTWRPPQTEEEEKLKAEGRARGTNRRIKRYLSYLEQGLAVPEEEQPNDVTLVEWIRHCKRSGLYEQGKLLYENGGLNLDNLPEEVIVNVEEDYQVCVRLLARGPDK